MFKKVYIVIAIIIALYADTECIAQTNCTFTLSGKVLDSLTTEDLEFAVVGLKPTTKVAYTRSNGSFEFTGLCTGNYTLVCEHIECNPLVINILLRADTSITLILPHTINELGKVEIKTTQVEKPIQGVSVLSADRLNATRGQTLGDAVKTLPGVYTLNTGSTIAKPILQGLSGNRVLIMANGVRLEGQQWGNEHGPEVDPFLANKITVVRGASAVRYGPDAFAGVIVLEPEEMPTEAKLTGRVNLAGFSNGRMGVVSGLLQSAFKKNPALAWRLQGTARRGGNIFTPNYGLANTGVAEYNFSGTVSYKKQNWGAELFYSRFSTQIGIFRGSHIGNLTDLMLAINRPVPFDTAGFSYKIDRPYQDLRHHTVKSLLYFNTSSTSKLTIQYAFQYNLRREFDKDIPSNDSIAALNRPELFFALNTNTLDVNWTNKTENGWTTSVGLFGMRQGNIVDGRIFIPNFVQYTVGTYAIQRYEHKRYAAELGLRYDTRFLEVYRRVNGQQISPNYQFGGLSANVGGQYKPVNGLSIKLNAATAFRAPGVNELYSNGLHHGAAAVEFGDTTMQTERTYSFTFNTTYQNRYMSVDFTAYYNKINNFIYLEPKQPPTLTIKGAFPTFVYKQVDARFTGIDWAVAVTIAKKINLFNRSALLWAFNKTTNNYLIFMPPNRFETGARYTFIDKGWLEKTYIEASYMHVAEQKRVPQGIDYAPSPAAYGLVNLEAGFTAHIKNSHIGFVLAATNLLNTEFRDYLDRFRYYTAAMERNVSLRINIPINEN